MDMSTSCLETIESAIARPSSPLARALSHLSGLSGGRGTCLLLENDELGETLIADQAWTLGRDDTLRRSGDCALVDLRQQDGFTRIAVLVQPAGTESTLGTEGCALAIAALDVAAALADIAVPLAPSKPMPDPRNTGTSGAGASLRSGA